MKTRFDIPNVWITAGGEAMTVQNMETPHLMSTVKMLIQKPSRVLSMLIDDIENATFTGPVWTVKDLHRKQSLNNVTSLSADELVEYVKETPLFRSMVAELQARGVNTDNVVQLFSSADMLNR